MLIDVDWSWLMLIDDEHWCWLMQTDADQCLLMQIDAEWCWCWLMPKEGSTRFPFVGAFMRSLCGLFSERGSFYNFWDYICEHNHPNIWGKLNKTRVLDQRRQKALLGKTFNNQLNLFSSKTTSPMADYRRPFGAPLLPTYAPHPGQVIVPFHILRINERNCANLTFLWRTKIFATKKSNCIQIVKHTSKGSNQK